MSVKIVDWRITSRCTGTCGFCYAANDLASIDTKDVKKVVETICSTNCETVCITGGEPLLDPKFAITIMQELKKCNLDIYLSTNGTNYTKNITYIEPLIAKLSLPLDGFSIETNQINGRLADSFSRVKDILSLYNSRHHSFPIKVATVLTKKNKDIQHFKNMYDFLKSYKIDLWEIYQFIPESRGQINESTYAISDMEWENFRHELQPMVDHDAGNRCFKVFFSGRKERNAAYFIVQPDASVIIPLDNFSTSCEEKTIGNLLTDNIESIRKEWLKRVSINNVRGLGDVRALTRSTQKQFDEIDRNLLYTLDKFPLQNNDFLSKVMGDSTVSTECVGTRIDRLYQREVIKKVIPIVNILHFGFNIYLYTLLFNAKSPLSEIINGLRYDENTAWVAECYDLDKTKHQPTIFRIAVFAKSNGDAINVTNRLIGVFNQYIEDAKGPELVSAQQGYYQHFMLRTVPSFEVTPPSIKETKKNTKLDSEDYTFLKALLDVLKSKTRPTFNVIATKMGISDEEVEQYISKLETIGVLNRFQPVFDSNLLGYKCYLLFIKFKTLDCIDTFVKYAKSKKEISHINYLSGLLWNIDVEIKVEYPDQCFKLVEEIKQKFDWAISSTHIMGLRNEHKFEFLLPAILEAIKEEMTK